jgi:hypothetical protein
MQDHTARLYVLFVVLGIFTTFTARAAVCPVAIDANDCVANDLQPTGAEITNGPTHCTVGETFAATVRIKFEDGGGANTRYSVGFYVGDNGESPIGGDSCTFDSLQPIGAPYDFTSGTGGFLEANGDACGDIEKSVPTYKDIQLDSVLCKDADGDGNVDIGYVLTWENNANQADCQDPLDPAEFDPQPPKCLSDLEFDLPIGVELPPSIDVGKGALPSMLEEPGAEVTYPITIINDSPSVSDAVEVYAINDDPYGDITNQTDCSLPFVLAPSQSVTCNFLTNVSGVAGEIVVDTVTVFARDDEGNETSASDSAEVEIIEPESPPLPGDLRVVKFASPAEVPEPGGMVQYDVLVANLSLTPVTLTSLEDDLYGDLNGKGSCSVPQLLTGENPLYFCAFQEEVAGQPTDVITDIITASGYDDLPDPSDLFAQASAEVTIYDLNSKINVTKVANSKTVPEPGDNVVFSVQVQNNSVADSVTINTLIDSQLLGAPGGDCTVPFTLAPGGDTYQCSYPGLVEGNAGDFVTNVLVALGRDDDDKIVEDFDAETVFIIGAAPSIQVVKVAIPTVALTTGSPVRYVVGIQNTSSSADPALITSLVDVVNSVEKNLDGLGTCNLDLTGDGLILAPSPSPDSFYTCSFLEPNVSGVEGVPLIDTVIAGGEDDETTPVIGSASATVNFVEIEPGEAELKLVKIASPAEVPEPGGDVTYTVVIANSSDQGDLSLELTVNSLIDDLYGDLNGKGDCALPIVLPVGDYTYCSFTEQVTGPVGSEITDTIIATATYREDQVTSAEAQATTTITDIPSSISVTKTANPSTVLEPGEDVTFSIFIDNTSQVDEVTISSLIDNIHGDLNGQGSCTMPQTLAAGGESYECEFTVFVGGPGGTEEIDTVTASGLDDDGIAISGLDQATVAILDQPPSITAIKTADPSIVEVPGGPVTFKFTTTNTSESDEVVLDTLVDSVFGDLNGRGSCSVPQSLQPGESYTCDFDANVAGMLNETHLDTIVVTGTSDDGDLVSAGATAIVSFFYGLHNIPVMGQVGLAILMLMLALVGVHTVRNRK